MTKSSDVNKALSDARADRLNEWIKDHFKNQKEFIEKFSLNQGEISQLVLKKRVLGERKARTLEETTGMPFRYLDGLSENINSQRIEVNQNYSIERFNKILIFLNKIERLKKEGKLNAEHISIINIEFDDAIDHFEKSIEKIDKFLAVWCPSSDNEAQKTA